MSFIYSKSKLIINSSFSNYSNQSAAVLNGLKALDERNELRKFYYNIEKKLSIVPVILMLAGTLGNMLAFYVLTRKKLRTQSTMLYFASLTIIDTISLYQW